MLIQDVNRRYSGGRWKHMTGDPNEALCETVSQALNQQGFLFQQRVLHEAKTGFEGQEHRQRWSFEGAEYPVTAVNGRQTKIDFVFQHAVRLASVFVLSRSQP